MHSVISAPTSEENLAERARALAGLTIAELAHAHGLAAPADLRRHKGFVGGLVERVLGASSGSKAQPDFAELGIELKTLPIGRNRRPVESTYVCTAPLSRLAEQQWEESVVRAKLARVLFVPIEGDRDIAVGARRIGTAWLWSPTQEQDALLKNDWMELAGAIGRGGVEALTAHLGTVMQVRPKAAHSQIRSLAFDEDGAPMVHNPRGFYLRATFTATLIPA